MFLFASMAFFGSSWYYIFGCLLTGLIASVLIDQITDYYTGRDRKPVGSIAEASQTGSATNIITGFAVGLETTALPIITLVIALLVSYVLGSQFATSIGITPTQVESTELHLQPWVCLQSWVWS